MMAVIPHIQCQELYLLTLVVEQMLTSLNKARFV